MPSRLSEVLGLSDRRSCVSRESRKSPNLARGQKRRERSFFKSSPVNPRYTDEIYSLLGANARRVLYEYHELMTEIKGLKCTEPARERVSNAEFHEWLVIRPGCKNGDKINSSSVFVHSAVYEISGKVNFAQLLSSFNFFAAIARILAMWLFAGVAIDKAFATKTNLISFIWLLLRDFFSLFIFLLLKALNYAVLEAPIKLTAKAIIEYRALEFPVSFSAEISLISTFHLCHSLIGIKWRLPASQKSLGVTLGMQSPF